MTSHDVPPDPLGNDKGLVYATAARIEAILDEAVLSGALSAAERRAFVIVERSSKGSHDAPPDLRTAIEGLQAPDQNGMEGPDYYGGWYDGVHTAASLIPSGAVLVTEDSLAEALRTVPDEDGHKSHPTTAHEFAADLLAVARLRDTPEPQENVT